MTEPVLFGIPLSMAFLYFITYSVLGWCMETLYCSVLEKKFVPRGFLYGPLCPIYGVGVLMMICWFQPLMGNPVLFYLVATVCMSAWEYFVGWFLETTTHIKYWDYSMYRFNLKGRICLWVCLIWGVLSFVILYFVHPPIARLLSRIPIVLRYVLDGFLLGVLSSDAAVTVYQLARTSQLLAQIHQTADELRIQAHLGHAEFSDKMDKVKETFSERLENLRPEQIGEHGMELKSRYDDLVSRAEIVSRRFRNHYRSMHASDTMQEAFSRVEEKGKKLKNSLEKWKEEKREK